MKLSWIGNYEQKISTTMAETRLLPISRRLIRLAIILNRLPDSYVNKLVGGVSGIIRNQKADRVAAGRNIFVADDQVVGVGFFQSNTKDFGTKSSERITPVVLDLASGAAM